MLPRVQKKFYVSWIWRFLRLILLHVGGILFSIESYSDYIWVCLLFLVLEISLCVMAQTRHLSMLRLGLVHYHGKGTSYLSYKFSNWDYPIDETGFSNHLFVFLLFSSGLVMHVLRPPLDLQPTSVHHVSSTWVNCSTIAKRKRVLMHKCVSLSLNNIYVKTTSHTHMVSMGWRRKRLFLLSQSLDIYSCKCFKNSVDYNKTEMLSRAGHNGKRRLIRHVIAVIITHVRWV